MLSAGIYPTVVITGPKQRDKVLLVGSAFMTGLDSCLRLGASKNLHIRLFRGTVIPRSLDKVA